MKKRYFRKDSSAGEPSRWIEMTGQEFYQFVTSPEGRTRHFIDMGDVVLEASEAEAKAYRAECNHRYYLQEQEDGWSTVSLYTLLDSIGRSGEEILFDPSQDVEEQTVYKGKVEALRTALAQLDQKSRKLIFAIYLSNEPKTERRLAEEWGVSQNAIHKRKMNILKTLKFQVVKIEKSQQ